MDQARHRRSIIRDYCFKTAPGPRGRLRDDQYLALSPSFYALAGMEAVVTGTTLAPITAAILTIYF